MSEAVPGLAVLALIGALIWGSHEQNRADEVQAKLETAQSQMEDIKAKSAALVSATDSLKQQVDRFETENWRDVVPDAKDSAEEADSAKDEL